MGQGLVNVGETVSGPIWNQSRRIGRFLACEVSGGSAGNPRLNSARNVIAVKSHKHKQPGLQSSYFLA